MRTNYIISLLLLLPVLFIATWIGSIYDSNINNLLDADGIRWGVAHIMSNYAKLPLSYIIMMLVVASVVVESGWLSWIFPKNHPLMLKQLRAYTYTNLTCIFVVGAFALLLFIPSSPLLNAFGGYSHSPLSQGGFALLMLLVIMLANIYGYLSGQLTTLADFIFAHTHFLRKYSFAFISLFVVSQVYGCVDYSNLLAFLGPTVNTVIMYVLILLCFIG